MDQIEQHQQKLLERTRNMWPDSPLSDATAAAFMATPRHRFVQRYRPYHSQEWQVVTRENLSKHLSALYTDGSLALFGDDDNSVPSTISQPSLVLHMLDMLQIEEGHQVFELGAGSGWNAAFMGRLVGKAGQVHSLEIIPEMAQAAAENIANMGIKNVNIVEADGGAGYSAGAPYDRAIFTAGSYDVPHHFYEQIKEGGLLLIVIKNGGGGDCLMLLRKVDDHFESLDSLPCGFVPMRGKYEVTDLAPITLDQLPNWENLKDNQVSKIPFWWGSKGKSGMMWATIGIRSFLEIIEPSFKIFKEAGAKDHEVGKQFFGLWGESINSLVIAKDESLISYGSSVAKNHLIRALKNWIDLGMPSVSNMNLHIYRAGKSISAGKNQWLVKRVESQFLWHLDN
ncbi:MAG: protein-L-isoaspartate O-methyltransferase [Anaerolineae bacterium]